MKYNNSKKAIYTPIILALVLIAGIMIGHKLIPSKNQNVKRSFYSQSDKINSMIKLIQENYVDKINTDSIEEMAIPKILEALDPHTVYIPVEDMQSVNETMEGNFDGIGVQFNIQNDTILIINTISGGPSEKLGVLAGDRIIKINDSLFAGVGVTNKEVIKNLKGRKGTKVKIGVKRKGINELIYFEITRDKIPLFSVDVSYMINDKIGYIKISKFSATTYDEFLSAANKLLDKGMTKMILDLRDNGGGYLSAAVNIADEFLSDNKMIVYTDGASRLRNEYKATKRGICENIDVSVLIDTWSASASEILAGAIQDNDRGTIIGRRSFGKGLVQEPFLFPDGSGLRLTISRYYTPTGRCIQKAYKNGVESYFSDFYKRFSSGELRSADSIDFPDSLKYKTLEGKIVYGGGGIMPDIFIPVDTTNYSDYLRKVISKGLIYRFALNYSDKNRNKLSEFKDHKTINNYLNRQNILNDFIIYANKEDVSYKQGAANNSDKFIDIRLKAYIARNIINDAGYYPIMNSIDEIIIKTIEEMSSN